MQFNIYINDLFFALNEIDICNLGDDSTPYVCYSNLKSVLEKLEHNSELAIAWFEMNYMTLNTNKCSLDIIAKLDQDIVMESNDVKLLGVTIDNNLRFDKHVSNICLKANRKLSAFIGVAKFFLFLKSKYL